VLKFDKIWSVENRKKKYTFLIRMHLIAFFS